MPTLPLKPCPQSGCPALTTGGRCPAHQRPKSPDPVRMKRYDSARGNATARGYGYPWQKIRNAWLKRFPFCVLCGKAASVVDHIRPKSIGGRDDDSNYQSLCTKHHAEKSGRERRRGIF